MYKRSEVISTIENGSGGSNKKPIKKPAIKKTKKTGINKSTSHGTMNLNFN
jgi:hypothetical protein